MYNESMSKYHNIIIVSCYFYAYHNSTIFSISYSIPGTRLHVMSLLSTNKGRETERDCNKRGWKRTKGFEEAAERGRRVE